MKKILFTLLCIFTLQSMMAQAVKKAPATKSPATKTPTATTPKLGNYINYTILGKTYNFKTADVNGYYKKETSDEYKYTTYTLYVSYYGDKYPELPKLNITFYIPEGKKLEVGSYPVANILGYQTGESVAYIAVDRKLKNEDYEFYGTETGEEGTVEITAVNGTTLEGKFSILIGKKYGNGDKIELNDCTFKHKLTLSTY
jgi:hypothetical protein